MALVIKDLKKSYGNLKVLNGVSFNVKDSEFVCVIGRSGCGKTTLLKIIAGIERADSGEIIFDGRIGFVFQEDRLLPWKTALENVCFSLELLGIKDYERAKKLLEFVGLKGFENYYPKQLSTGMRQRVAFARALAIDPDLLLMDEPFANLDAQTREKMQEELLKLVKDKTVVFVTHSIDEAIYLADKIIVLTPRPARVLKEIEIELEKPRDRTSKEFMKLKRDINLLLSNLA